MSEYLFSEKYINKNEAIIFENKTGSNTLCGMGITFLKDGIYKVVVKNNQIIITEE